MANELIDPKRPNWVYGDNATSADRAPRPSLTRTLSAAGERVGAGLRGAAQGVADTAKNFAKGDSYQRSYMVGNGLRKSGPGVLAGLAVDSSMESFDTPTSDYYRRLGMDPAEGGGLKDLAVRSAGVVSDFGAKVLDAPVNAINAVSRAFGGDGDLSLPGGSFTENLKRNDKAPAVAAQPAPEAPGTPAAAGFMAGGPSAEARTALNAADAGLRARPGSDITKELSALPGQLPYGTQQGVVYRTRGANGETVFSGANVREGAQVVGGDGKQISTLQPLAATVNGGLFRGASSAGGSSAQAPAQAPQGPIGIGDRYGSGFGLLDKSAGARIARADRDLAIAASRGDDDGMAAARASAEIAGREDALATSERNTGTQAAASRYGDDRRLEGIKYQVDGQLTSAQQKAFLEQQAAAANRGLIRQAYAAAGGDDETAGRLLARAGYTDLAKGVYDSGGQVRSGAAERDKLVNERRSQLGKMLESYAPRVGDKQEPDRAFIDSALVQAERVYGPGFAQQLTNMPAEKQSKALADIASLARTGNVTAESSWFGPNQLPFDPSTVDYNGATVSRMGLFRAAVSDGKRGDVRVRFADGREGFIPAEKLTDRDMKTLEERGARIAR